MWSEGLLCIYKRARLIFVNIRQTCEVVLSVTQSIHIFFIASVERAEKTIMQTQLNAGQVQLVLFHQ